MGGPAAKDLPVGLWIGLSVAVIAANKAILGPTFGFPFPVALTLCQAAFFTAAALIAVKAGWATPVTVDRHLYVHCILPIGLLFGLGMWAGNAAYVHLSISFIQILKSLMPAVVHAVGVALGTQETSRAKLLILGSIVAGVGLAAFGEEHIVVSGVVWLLLSVSIEALRLHLAEMLLRPNGVLLNPITTIYCFGPVSMAVLSLIWGLAEAPAMLRGAPLPALWWLVLLAHSGLAFGLNMSLFLLMGVATADTMNGAGIIKDVSLMGLSWLVFRAPLSILNLGGYSMSMAGIASYNSLRMRKIQEARARAQADTEAGGPAGKEEQPSDPLAGLVQSQNVNPLVSMMLLEEEAPRKDSR